MANKTQLREHDYRMSDIDDKGRTPRFSTRLQEAVADVIRSVLPRGYDVYCPDDGKVWIEIENSGRIEVRPLGGNIVSVLVWVGSAAGEEALLKRLANVDLKTATEFIRQLLSAFDAASVLGGQYVSKAEEKDAQDADLAPADHHDPNHYSPRNTTNSNATDPAPGQVPEVYQDMESGGDDKTSQYDLSKQGSMIRKETPSANTEISKHLYDSGQRPNKAKAQRVGNVVNYEDIPVSLEEGQKSRKVRCKDGSKFTLVKDEHGNVQFLTEDVTITQKKKVWARDKSGSTMLYEVIQRLQ
jgi:hypothetical protein